MTPELAKTSGKEGRWKLTEKCKADNDGCLVFFAIAAILYVIWTGIEVRFDRIDETLKRIERSMTVPVDRGPVEAEVPE